MSLRKWLIVTLFLVGAAASDAQPTTAPATAPATQASMAPSTAPSTAPAAEYFQFQPAHLPQQFAVLTQRSIFVNGPQQVEDTLPGGAQIYNNSKALAERTLIFDGTFVENDRTGAFMEDSLSGQSVFVYAGDPLADGKVTDIQMDQLTYEAHGKVFLVKPGQNLAGGISPLPTTRIGDTPTTGPDVSPDVKESQIILEMKRKHNAGQ